MFNNKISFLHDDVSIAAILIVFVMLLTAFLLRAIIVYTLKNKYSGIQTSYKVNGIKFSYEYLKMKNIKKPILITNYKMMYFKRRTITLNEKIANSTSMWSQIVSLFISEKNINENKFTFIYEKSLWVIQLISVIVLFVDIKWLQYLGISILALSLLISLVLNVQSKKYIKIIFNTVEPFMNEEDKKQINHLLKYFGFYYIYCWFMKIPFLINDMFYFIKNNGIGR